MKQELEEIEEFEEFEDTEEFDEFDTGTSDNFIGAIGNDLEKLAGLISHSEDPLLFSIVEEGDEETFEDSDNNTDIDSFSSEESTVNASDFKESILKKKIIKLNNARSSAKMEETLVGIKTLLNESRDETKAYINNVHPIYSLGSIKKISLPSIGNKEFFAELASIFEKEYLTSKDSLSTTLTIDEFLNSNIKQRLLDLGARLSKSDRESLITQKQITPLDLLGSEYNVLRFISGLQEIKDGLDKRDSDNKAVRLEIAAMRTAISRNYTPDMYSSENVEDYTFIGGLLFNEDAPLYTCGSCGSMQELPYSLVSITILPFQGRSGKNLKNYVLAPGILAVKCPICGKYNTLTIAEAELLLKGITKNLTPFLDDYSKIASATCNTFAITKYDCSYELLKNILPHLIHGGEELESEFEMAENYTEEEEPLKFDYTKSLNNYRELIGFFKDRINTVGKENTISSPITVHPGVLGKAIPYTTDIKVCTDRLYTEESMSNLAIISKVMAATSGINYNELKRNAINSLLLFIKNSSLCLHLDFTRIGVQKAIIDSSAIIDVLDLKSIKEESSLINYLAGVIGFKGDVTTENFNVFKNSLSNYFKNYEKTLALDLAKREALVQQLKYCTRIFAFTPITNIPVIEDCESLMIYPDFVDFLNVTSDLMIITQSLERFTRLWKCRISKSATHKLKSIENINSLDNIKYAIELFKELNVLIFESGYPKKLKTEQALKLFSISHYNFDYRKIEELNALKKAFDDQDVFNIFKAVSNLQFMESIIPSSSTDMYVYDTSIYKPIRECISALLPDSLKFVEKYGSSDLDRLCYYLDGIFSREEITKEYSARFRGVCLNKLLQREPDESLSKYLIRVTNAQANNSKELINSRTEYMNIIEKYEAVLFGCNMPVVYCSTDVRELSTFLSMLDLIYFILNKDLNTALMALGVNGDICGKFIKDFTYKAAPINLNTTMDRYRLLYSITTTPAFNNFGDFSSLRLQDADTTDNIDLQMSDEERVETILKNKEMYLNSTRHLKERDFIEHLDFTV